MKLSQYFNRDLSWLSFNERVMEEAANDRVPLLERLKFLSIYSSNLDEFYRVRMPVLSALQKISRDTDSPLDHDENREAVVQAREMINQQLERFGEILNKQLIPKLRDAGVTLLYNEPFPEVVNTNTRDYFFSDVLAFLQPVELSGRSPFFPENNKLYFVIEMVTAAGQDMLMLLNIPSDELPRFLAVKTDQQTYIAFLDDIVRNNLKRIFTGCEIKGCHSIKITRDAELDLKDEYPGDLSEEIEKQLRKRDFGLATRLLYQADMPLRALQTVTQLLDLKYANATAGGRYHNLKDFFSLPLKNTELLYDDWKPVNIEDVDPQKNDRIIHAPYQSYHAVLKFFNEAAIDPDVEEIYTTLYRVANDSRIVNALISAAKNGKFVQVMVELKARFDEANNLKWARKMKAVGVKIVYSIVSLKVHAKIALVKRRKNNRMVYSGLLATGNFNESTARFYTDHILFTSHAGMLREMELVFMFLARREKPVQEKEIQFKHLLVAGFNLQRRFIELIDREMAIAAEGKPASITLKMNNLEERVLIDKLYEASSAGVKIELIVRSICCLIPGVKGMSENITVRRIIDRYLEHGRIFIFHNNGSPEVFLGSADWMNRNIYNRIEVCFPVYDDMLKDEIIRIINLQLADNTQAVMLDEQMRNVPVRRNGREIQSQKEIYRLLSAKSA
ncbi:MAG TPA: polyphosphate kinase 1 [Mucilaginibacter sp.]|nr:polyphosphate kinase 1 [Mucilaginibacter sp.]